MRVIDKREFSQKANSQLDKDSTITEVFRDNKLAQEDLNEIFSHPDPQGMDFFYDNYYLERLNPGAGDLFASWLMRTNGLNIGIITLIIGLIGLIPALISIAEGNFNNPDLFLSTLKDFGYWEQYPIAMPIVVLLSTMYFRRFPVSLLELVLQGVFPITRDQWNHFVTVTAKSIYQAKIVVWSPYLIALSCSVFLSKIYLYDTPDSWYMIGFSSEATIAGWFLAVNIFILYFLIATAVIRIIATSVILNRFFEFLPNIQPLHPDGAGGLLPLGKLSKSLNLGVFLFGIISAAGIYVNHITYQKPVLSGVNIAIMCAYVLGASIVFFIPLLSAHTKMKEAKYNIIQSINYHFEKENRDLMKSLEGSGVLNKEKVSNIESMLVMHNIARRMPVYPFNIETITSFLGSIIIPLLLYLVQILIINIIQPPFGP